MNSDIVIEDNDLIDVDTSSFDVEPFGEETTDLFSDEVSDDAGELTEEIDSMENFEESVDLSPIEDPYMNQEFAEDSSEIVVESKQSTGESNDLAVNEDEFIRQDDSIISDIEKAESWIPNDVSFENEDGELTDIKMDADFLEEKYSEAVANGNQDMADRYRALHDIVSISKDLELTDGDPEITQLGGLHKNVKGQIDGFESHHIPAQSVQNANPRDLPTIALSQEDHTLTDSYGWKSNHEYEPFLPDGIDEHPTYKQEAEEMIDKGNYTDLVRDELYNIRDIAGHKYDGAIKQYLNELSNMIAKDGIPNSK